MGPKKLIFLTLIVFIVKIFRISLATLDADRKCQMLQVCRTATCRETAFSMLEKMDQSVNPCDDFYHYVCGNFTENAVIAEDRSINDLFTRTHDKVQEQLKTSIENQITDSDPQAFKLLQSYYKTCMNEEQVEKNSENELIEILKNLGGWPVLVGETWDESTFDWKELVYKFRETGYSFNQFIDFIVSPDEKNNSRKLVNLDQAYYSIPQEYLSQGIEQEIVKAYLKFMVDFAEILGADRKKAEQELSESLSFEIELAKISLPSSERRNGAKLYNPMTVQELQIKYPSIPWLDYMNRILSPVMHVEVDVEVIVKVPSFFEKLPDLLARTPKRTLANYAFWRLAQESVNQLGERVQKVYGKFIASMTGNSGRTPRWQDCIDQVNGRLFPAAGALYVRRHFDKSAKYSALEMIQNIRQSFEQILIEVDWMDEQTKKAAQVKLAQMIPLVAYPDEYLDDEELSDYYKDLKIYPESFLKTVLSFNLFTTSKKFEELRRPVIKGDWTDITAAVVNAFYKPSTNTIRFPAGILQGDLFNTDNPKYMNYAGIGSIVGHEMTHGFDDKGSRFDKEGNLVDWWDPKTKREYLSRTRCIVDQYSNYTVKEVGLKLNGEHTQGENIADNGGVKEAYFAYDALEKKNGPEPLLPEFESYTTKQMFWIANANMWCAKYRSQYLKNLIITDPHSPRMFRVIGPMSNMPEFSIDFNCPVGSVMNPIKKCTVW